MWSHDPRAALSRFIRFAAIAMLAALTSACFQPLYGDRTVVGSGTERESVRDVLAAIEVDQIAAPRGTPEARLAVDMRNHLIFALTGGGPAAAPLYRLNVRMVTQRNAIIVDIQTGRTEAEIAGVDVTFTLIRLATGKVALNGTTFARVSSDIPGLQQRFARSRAQRDAEERAGRVIADQIRARLASHLVAGT